MSTAPSEHTTGLETSEKKGVIHLSLQGKGGVGKSLVASIGAVLRAPGCGGEVH
jgi:hypothetical protein